MGAKPSVIARSEWSITFPSSPSPFELHSLVLQPTGFCNLDCRYCYLANRDVKARMPIHIAQKVADDLGETGTHVDLIWHAGEPLSVGESYLRQLFSCFEPLRQAGLVKHAIQTNGTLINDRWCRFFNEFGVSIGLSIDGPQRLNDDRVDRRGSEAFNRIVAGAHALRKNKIPFSTISVISRVREGVAAELVSFLESIGASSAAFNVVETDGAFSATALSDHDVRQFWAELRDVVERGTALPIREVRQLFEFASFVCRTPSAPPPPRDLLLSVDLRGRVRAISPELIEMRSAKYGDFVIANIMTDSLATAIHRATKAEYVTDFVEGARKCAASCDYFSFCRGGALSNKLAEHGVLTETETTYCRQSRKLLWDAFVPMFTGVERCE